MTHKVKLVKDLDVLYLRPGYGGTFSATFNRKSGYLVEGEFSFPDGSTKVYHGTKSWSYFIPDTSFDRYLMELVFEGGWDEVAWKEPAPEEIPKPKAKPLSKGNVYEKYYKAFDDAYGFKYLGKIDPSYSWHSPSETYNHYAEVDYGSAKALIQKLNALSKKAA